LLIREQTRPKRAEADLYQFYKYANAAYPPESGASVKIRGAGGVGWPYGTSSGSVPTALPAASVVILSTRASA